MIEPMYLVSVESTWLRFMPACTRLMTRWISQRPTTQKMMAAMTLIARSIAVVLRKSLMA
jgi:hypothetical protein